jgi:uncharacterized protein involved in exopolysaccharide biosynthesis
MVLFFLLVMAVVAAAAFLGPRSYRSEAKLFLRLGRENVTLDPTATLGQPAVVAVPPSRDSEVNSVIDLLKSQVLLEQVVAELGPDAILGRGKVLPREARAAANRQALAERRSPWSDDPPLPGDDRYRATVALEKMLEVEAVKKSNVIVVACTGPSPEVSRAIVACLIDLYLEQHVRLNRTPGAYHFLEEQTTQLRQRLTRAEEELRALKDRTGIASPEAQRQVLVTRIGRLRDELLQAEGAAAASEATIKRLRDRLAALPGTHVSGVTKGYPNAAADTMRAQLYTLEVKEKELSARYGKQHREVREVRRQLATARTLLAAEQREREQVTTAPNKLHEEAQLALLREEPVLASLKARAGALRMQLAAERARLKKLNSDQMRLARLQREVELHESHYRKYAENLQQLQIDGALASEKMSNISVVQPATFDARPVRPRRSTILGAGLVFAVLGSIGLALLCERLSPAFTTPEEVQDRLGLPVLATVPCLRHRPLTRNGEH